MKRVIGVVALGVVVIALVKFLKNEQESDEERAGRFLNALRRNGTCEEV